MKKGTKRWSPHRRVSPGRTAQPLAFGAASVVIVAVLVNFGRGEITRGSVISALLAGGFVIVLRARQRQQPTRGADRHVDALALMWLVLTIGPLHSIVRRSIHDAVNSLGADSTVKVAVYALIGAFCVVVLRDTVSDAEGLRLPPIFLALPAIALASSVWSPTAAYSFGRGLQMCVIGLLAVTTLAVRDSGGSSRRILDQYFRFFVSTMLVLIAARVVLGPHYVLLNESNIGRFALIGMHPNVSAFLVSIALVIDITGPRRSARRWNPARLIRLPIFALSLLAMHSRTSLIVLAAGFAVAGLVVVRRSPTVRYRYLTPIAATVGTVGILFLDRIYSYALRGGTSDELTGGHGRLELWQEVPNVFETMFDWVFGLGWGQANLAFIDELPWANSAHNSLLSVLIELGLVGALTYLLVLGRCVTAAVRSPDFRSDSAPLVAALITMLFVQMTAADSLAGPYGGLVLVYLLLATAWPSTTSPRVEDDADARARSADEVSEPAMQSERPARVEAHR